MTTIDAEVEHEITSPGPVRFTIRMATIATSVCGLKRSIC